MNSNDPTAKFYDIVYKSYKFKSILDKELDLIEGLVNSKSNILDVGCGTGRHLIPLYKKGYNIEGIDLSSGMLDVLKEKITSDKDKVKLHNQSIFDFESNEKYDLIIMMWNTLFEIASNKVVLRNLFEKLSELKKENGKILVNIDNIEIIDLSNLRFEIEEEFDKREYVAKWESVPSNSKNDISEFRETIKVFDLEGNKINTVSTNISQRWWSTVEIDEVVKEVGLELKILDTRFNDEIYILIN